MKPKINYKLSDFPFNHNLKTRWRHLDAFQHINNATILSYMEDARVALFSRWGINYKETGLIVAGIKIDYLQQIEHPSKLEIGSRISRLGTKSFDLESVIFLKGTDEALAFMTCFTVCFDFVLNKSIPVFEKIKKDYKI